MRNTRNGARQHSYTLKDPASNTSRVAAKAALGYTPGMSVFRTDFPDDSDFPFVVVGGMGTEPSSTAMADSYLLAASLLIDSWEGRKEPWMVCYPILYLCRH